MKENSWQDCLENSLVYTITINKSKAISLIKTAISRIDFLNSNKITQENINFIFEGYYSSALELLHALILLDGFNVKNHLCLGFYLKDKLKKEELFRLFDNCRYKKNTLIYYGKTMSFLTAKSSLENLNKLVLKLKELLKNKNIKLDELD